MPDAAGYVVLPSPAEGAHGKGTNSALATAASVAKAVLGAGILSLSWAYFYSTMWTGVFLTVLMGFLAAHGFALIGLCSGITGQDSYSKVWAHVFGKRWAWIPELVTLLYCTLSIVSYLIIIGDYVPRGFKGLAVAGPLFQNRLVAIFLASALLLPLNLKEDLSALGPFSIVGTMGALYTCAVLFVEAEQSGLDASDWQSFRLKPGLFVMIPAVTFAFNGHFNAADLYQQLEGRSTHRWLVVTATAFGACFGIIVICGVSGYLMFGSDLSLPGRSNVLSAPELQTKPAIIAAYLATTLSVAMSIPLYLLQVCNSLENMWLTYSPPTVRALGERLSHNTRHKASAALTIFATVALSMVLEDLGLVNSINGAVSGCLLMFVFPSLMYLRCTDREKLPFIMHRWLPYVSIVIGTLAGVCGVVTSILLFMGCDLSG